MKIKKRTRAQILERLYEIAHNTKVIHKYVQFDEPNKYVTVVNTLHKGKTMAAAHCTACGEKYILEPLWGYGYSHNHVVNHFRCPSCGNEYIAHDTGKKFEQKRYRLVLKTEDGFEFLSFSSHIAIQIDDTTYDHRLDRCVDITSAGVFDRKSGFYVATIGGYGCRKGEYKVLRRMSNDEESLIFWLKDFTHSNVSEDECRSLLEEGNAYYKNQKKESKEKSAQRREKKEEEERLMREAADRAAERKRQEYEEMRLADNRWIYEAKDVDIESLFQQPIMSILYSAPFGEEATYMVGCAKCGHVEEVVGASCGQEYTCHNCGNHVNRLVHSGSYERDETHQTAVLFENTNFDENDLLIRVFQYKVWMTTDGEISKTVYESRRIFAGKEAAVYYRNSESARFEKSEDYDRLHAPCSDTVVLPQNNDEIVEIVNNSCLKYSGLIDSWGLGKYKYKWSTKIPNLIYLKAWYVNPAIEIIMKSNLTHITDRFIEDPDQMNTGKTLAEVLGVGPGFVKMIIKTDPQYRVMRDMASLYEADKSMTFEIYQQINADDLTRQTLIYIARNYGITYDKILKYLQAAYDHQCIIKHETLSVWSDYLRMASLMGVNLSDKTKMFPSSLKKEHDIASFAYRAVKVEMDAKAFAAQAEVNSKYEFETEDMMVIVPKTPQEVIEEANAQSNCLRSYIERVKRGETVVAFVRKKSDPDKTFLSAEILNGELVQLKGWCNSNPRTPEIVKFVKEWAKERNIVIKC